MIFHFGFVLISLRKTWSIKFSCPKVVLWMGKYSIHLLLRYTNCIPSTLCNTHYHLMNCWTNSNLIDKNKCNLNFLFIPLRFHILFICKFWREFQFGGQFTCRLVICFTKCLSLRYRDWKMLLGFFFFFKKSNIWPRA